MVAYKRKRVAMSYKAPNRSSLGKSTAARTARKVKSTLTAVRRILASSSKDTVDTLRHNNNALPANSSVSMCLSSSTAFTTAAGTTGLFTGNGDSCHIKSVRIWGECYSLTNGTVSSSTEMVGFSTPVQRHVLVWYKIPATLAAASGATLPGASEWLDPTALDLTVRVQQSPENRLFSNEFTILSDKTFQLSMNQIDDGGATGASINFGGSARRKFNYVVKVNKKVEYVKPCNDTNPGGHFDSSIQAGQVRSGLLMLYVMSGSTVGNATWSSIATRVSYVQD